MTLCVFLSSVLVTLLVCRNRETCDSAPCNNMSVGREREGLCGNKGGAISDATKK